MASRSLDDLREPFRSRAVEWLRLCREAGLDPLVYCTLRDAEEQAYLYAQGRTRPGRIVTWAGPGRSAHNHGLACDFVPLIGGKPEWTAGSVHYQIAVEIAEGLGMESASKWEGRKREWPHLQEANWRSLI